MYTFIPLNTIYYSNQHSLQQSTSSFLSPLTPSHLSSFSNNNNNNNNNGDWKLPNMSLSGKSISKTIQLSSSRDIQWKGNIPCRQVQVNIERPKSNQRIISACNLINAPLSIVWTLLTDYNNLSTYIPNLVISKQLNTNINNTNGIRLEQCGAQKILGFQFKASLIMDMKELFINNHEQCILFDLVSSSDFNEFSGIWKLKQFIDPITQNEKTQLFYSVDIIPKGLVPVAAIEWRVAEDIPQNLDAVRLECERRKRIEISNSIRSKHNSK